MQDRVPLYPGRVKLTPVSGQENTFDMTLADEPTTEGTPLNKQTLLQDDTAALFGLGTDATPDDVFRRIPGIQIQVTAPTGSTVKAVKGSTTITATESSGTWLLHIPEYGTWTVKASKGSDSKSVTVDATESKLYTVSINYYECWGVMWDTSSTATALTRLTPSSDPLGLVNVTVTEEPVPAVGSGAGSSPFDGFLPYSGMIEWNVNNQAITYKKGQSGFSRSSYDTVVFIPVFYIRKYVSGTKVYFYLSNKSGLSGFTQHPGSGKCIAKYNTISGYYSKTGAAPLVSITRATARTNSRNKGTKWCQNYYLTWCAVWWLYLIEFADWDSQSIIGRGYVDENSAAINTGGCDSMTYHTGMAAGTNGKTAVIYRNIENLWGNVSEWVDGINFTERKAYYCATPANFADDTSSNYTNMNLTLASSGYISALGNNTSYPWAFIPTGNSGSATTYIPDHMYSVAGWQVLRVGGLWNYGDRAGLFCFNVDAASSGSNASLGSRLAYLPTTSEINTMTAAAA